MIIELNYNGKIRTCRVNQVNDLVRFTLKKIDDLEIERDYPLDNSDLKEILRKIDVYNSFLKELYRVKRDLNI